MLFYINLFLKNVGVPLFLAKDVFSTCNLKQSNVQRIHARYSKSGLATKVLLEDFRIDGICQNKMWFYSIQGLFEVIFHYHKRDQQKHCLKLLGNVWLQHSDDELLPENMSIRLARTVLNDGKSLISQDKLLSKTDNAMDNEEIVTESMNDGDELSNVTYVAHTGNDNIEVSTSEVYTQTDQVRIVPASTYVTVSQQTDDEKHMKWNVIDTVQSMQSHQSGSVNNKCPYCLYFEQHNLYKNPSFVTCLVKLNQFIMFIYSESEQRFLQIFSDIVSVFLDNYPKLVMPDSFLTEFLDKFNNIESNFEEGKIKDIFLNLICKWLGIELHKFEHEISSNVKEFMQNHIHCIDNLPPSEEIINEIFPSCMKELVYNWMNPVNNETSTNSVVNDQKRFKFSTTNKPNFQVIQLILEFANNALISGVAHVVFSRITVNNC